MRKKKDTLVSMCKERNIEPSGMKYEIVERLALALNEESPESLNYLMVRRRCQSHHRTSED